MKNERLVWYEAVFMRCRASYSRLLVFARVCLALALAALFPACRSGSGQIDPSSVDYPAAVSAFYVGLAAIQTGEDTRAEEHLTRVTQLVPAEPAAWADLGLLA